MWRIRMVARIMIKVLTAETASAPKTPFINAFVTFIPKHLIRENPSDPMMASGLEPYWKEDWQAETYTHTTNGRYLPDLNKITSANLTDADNPALDPKPGEWLLVVWADDKTPVIQRITLEERNGILHAKAGWKSEDANLTGSKQARAATVSIANYANGDAAQIAAENTLITVTLFPTSNFFFMAGTDYDHKGTRFIIFAENRMKQLFKDGVIDAGARIALFNPQEGTRHLVVKAHTGWVTVSKKDIMSTTAPNAGGDDERMGILSYYEYLHCLGTEAPQTLIETGIFSHAYYMGPILWNTYDRSGSDIDRDPSDLDGRSKDWQAPGTMSNYSKLKDAFHPNGFFKLWGCHWNPFYTEKLKSVNKLVSEGKPRDEFTLVHRNLNSENISPEYLKFDLYQRSTVDPIKKREYCSAAASFLGKPCWGAPMGNQANYIGGEMTVVTNDSTPFFNFVEREFSLASALCKDKTGHFDYSLLYASSAGIPSWNTHRWARSKTVMNRELEGKNEYPFFRLPGSFYIIKEANPTLKNMNVTVESRSGMHTAGIEGHLYIFTKTEPVVLRYFSGTPILMIKPHGSSDTAVLSDDQYNFYLYTRSSSSDPWALYTANILAVNQVKNADGKWIDDPGGITNTISNGLLWTDSGEVW